MKKSLLALAAGLLTLAACSSHQDPNNDPAYAPEVNPHPKYFMMVAGHIDPSLINKIHLQIIANYQTHNKDCKYDASGGLEGAMIPRQNSQYYLASTDNQGNYNLMIPLDNFLPGACNWSIANVQYSNINIHYAPIQATIAYFGDDSKHASLLGKSIWHCDKQQCELFHLQAIGKSLQAKLLLMNGYNYQINFILKSSI